MATKPTKKPAAVNMSAIVAPHDADIERQRLSSLIHSMADAVIALDNKQHVVLSNGAAQDILNVNDSLDGKSIRTLFKPVDSNNQPVDIHRLIADCTTQYTTRDWRLFYAKDDHINLYVSIAPVHMGFGQGASEGWVLLLRDITR